MARPGGADPGPELGLRRHLPLALAPLAVLPPALERASLDQANLEVLGALIMLEAGPGEACENGSERAGAELARLELKLNLLLELVGGLAGERMGLPPARAVTLRGSGLGWPASGEERTGDLYRAQLYCSTCYPRPLSLHCRVRGAETRDSVAEVEADYAGMAEAVRERLERYLFVYHRRRVARARRLTSAAAGTGDATG